MKIAKTLLYIFIALTTSTLNAQSSYDEKWNLVEVNEGLGKFKTAATLVDEIYVDAKQEQNDQQVIKSFIYKSKFLMFLDENARQQIISEIEKLIDKKNFPTDAILESIYAEMLWQYYKENAYKIKKRSKVDFPENSIAYESWDIKTFLYQISKHFNNSLKHNKRLKKIPSSNYSLLINDEGIDYQPTLFDFLANRSLNFHKEHISYYYPKQPEIVNKIELLKQTEDLGKVTIIDTLKFSPEKETLKLFIELENFHLQHDTIAYSNIVVHRLKHYLNEIKVNVDKDAVYLNTLNELSQRFKNNEASIYFYYNSISKNIELSNTHDAKYNEKLKHLRVEAKKACDSILSNYSNSRTTKYCKLFLSSITQQTFSIETGEYQIPNQPILAQVTTTNIDSVNIQAFKIPYNKYINDSIAFEVSRKSTPVFNINRKTINKHNYFDYSTEIDLPKLDIGTYLLIAKPTSYKNADLFKYKTISVSNLLPISYKSDGYEHIRILNRSTGKPIKSVTVTISGETSTTNHITNDKGITKIDLSKKGSEKHDIVISKKSDSISYYDYYYYYNSKGTVDDNDEWDGFGKIFIDRGIYRPGQTLYFKGIVYENKYGKIRTVPNKHVSIYIYNANGDELEYFRLKTNKYGSVSGSYKIPKNILTGEFNIEIYDDEGTEKGDWDDYDAYYDKVDYFDDTSIDFLVEDYKRPTFAVNFDKDIPDLKLDEPVSIGGNAISFMGAPISNATVKYRINRKQQATSWRQRYNSEKIKEGITTTDVDGKYSIDFIASTPDSLIFDKRTVFEYKIEVDITDLNGETRTNSTIIYVGNINSRVNISSSNTLFLDAKPTVEIKSTNLNWTPTTANISIKIYKQENKTNTYRKKSWEVVDEQIISKEDYKKLFPFEKYDSKLDIASPEKKELIYQFNIDSTSNHKVNLSNISFEEQGNYLIEAIAIDKYQDTLIKSKKIQIFNTKKEAINDKIFNYYHAVKNTKDEKYIEVYLQTALDSLTVYIDGFIARSAHTHHIKTIKKGTTTLRIPLKNDFKNLLDFNIYYAVNNEFQKRSFSTDFSESNGNFNIQVEHFNNKLTPNETEEFRFKLLDKNNKGVKSEILASMYDTSLDEFTRHEWMDFDLDEDYYDSAPNISSFTLSRNTWFNSYNNSYYYTDIYTRSTTYYYPKWYWYGFNFGDVDYSNKYYLKYLARKNENKDPIAGETIMGQVLDSDGMGLPGASVIIKGTKRGTATDFDGFFEIVASTGDVLEIGSQGMETKTITIGKSKTYYIALGSSTEILDEIVVLGYGSARKADVTQSISTVSTESFKEQPMSRVGEVLQGRASGVTVQEANDAYKIRIRGISSVTSDKNPLIIVDGVVVDAMNSIDPNTIINVEVLKDPSALAIYGSRGANGVIIITTNNIKQEMEELSKVVTRKNLKETAFFYPHLESNKKGEVVFSFDSPEALTSWKLSLLAHDKKMRNSRASYRLVTQKKLSITPNLPRFLREGDSITISTKINNLTEDFIAGKAMIQLSNKVNHTTLDNIVISEQIQKFEVDAKGASFISWKLFIPKDLQIVEYKIIAKSADFSDGESGILPVLPNKILVTKSQPLWIPGGSSQEVTFESLQETNTTRENHSFVVDYTSTPVWLAIKSLPYLMEFPHECAEQTFSRYFANTLALEILDQKPEIEMLFQKWIKEKTPLSELETNEELKSIFIAETPWFRELESDHETKKRLALLFDSKENERQQNMIIEKLKEMQLSNGAFPWFSGGNSNIYITQHIVSGFGHLKKLGIENTENKSEINLILKKAIGYLDSEIIKSYNHELEITKDSLNLYLTNSRLNYLYARSYFLEEYPLGDGLKNLSKKLIRQSLREWDQKTLSKKTLIAFILYRYGYPNQAKAVMDALSEQAIINDDGMYWKENKYGWYWYQNPTENQSRLIEAYTEILNDTTSVELLKQWLIKQRETQHWETTKETTYALYCLLIQGNNWLEDTESKTEIFTSGSKVPIPNDSKQIGDIKLKWTGNEINSKLANIKITNNNQQPGYGGVYWQYFESIDSIIPNNESPLKVKKEIFKNSNDTLEILTSDTKLVVGDIVTVRLEVKTDGNLEYIHLKDLRASGLEPIDVKSRYIWKDSAYYYMSTRDEATHFFFDELDKGTYVIEYKLRVNNSGYFSSGISTIQSMYAPAYSNNSTSSKIIIE